MRAASGCTPKDDEERWVPIPEFLIPLIAELCEGKDPDALIFGDGEIHMKLPHSKNGWFARAVKRLRTRSPSFPEATPHDLRHTSASLAVSAGANVKAIQQMLGHASAAMTLDVYADLFEDDLDAVGVALDQARATAIGSFSGSPGRL